MTAIYNNILQSKAKNEKLLAILIDPDKIDLNGLEQLIDKINQSPATHIFVGGSTVENNILQELVLKIKAKCSLPIVLFPGSSSQICDKADGILFLSLLSGRNPEFLIEHQVKAAPFLKKTQLEIIPTAYLLIESGSVTAVEIVSKTKPLALDKPNLILATAQAAEMMGNKLVYLEAGSGAKYHVPFAIVQEVANSINIPLIVGGGIRSRKDIQLAYDSGADLVVIGTAF